MWKAYLAAACLIAVATGSEILGTGATCLIQQKRSNLSKSLHDVVADAGRPALHPGFFLAPGGAVDIFGQASGPGIDPDWTGKDLRMLAAAVLALIAFDAVVAQRLCIQTLSGHLLLVGFWIALGLVAAVLVWQRFGVQTGISWINGYILEWMLSLDNLFVFHLIFKAFRLPPQLLHKALFTGVVGAVVCRCCFFWIVTSLLHYISWLHFIFGAFLIWSGIQAAQAESDEEEDISDFGLVKWLQWLLGPRLLDSYEDGSLALQKEGKLHFSLMLPLVFCLEVTDLFFALDSVSAKAAQIPDYWTAASSSIMALFGLRAMFFVIQDLMDMFELLKYGLCCILVFIGIELIIENYVDLPPQTFLVVIIAVFAVSIAGSAVRSHGRNRPLAEDTDTPTQKTQHPDADGT